MMATRLQSCRARETSKSKLSWPNDKECSSSEHSKDSTPWLLTLSNLNLSTRAASSPGSSEVASSHSSGLGFHSRMLNAQRMAWGLLLDTDDAGAATDACRQKAAADFKGAVGGNRSRFQSDNNHDSRMSHVNHATITTATGQW